MVFCGATKHGTIPEVVLFDVTSRFFAVLAFRLTTESLPGFTHKTTHIAGKIFGLPNKIGSGRTTELVLSVNLASVFNPDISVVVPAPCVMAKDAPPTTRFADQLNSAVSAAILK